MAALSHLEESQQFDGLWDNYADRVYNLSILLGSSTRNGWLLTRSAFLCARRDMADLEGNTPTYWLYRLCIEAWYAPYRQQKTFWKRWIVREKISWESLIPAPVEAGLTFLSDEQESLLLLFKALDYPLRLAAVLRLAEGMSVDEVKRIAPFREAQIEKFTKKALERLARLLASSGISIPADPLGRAEKVSSLLRQWRPLKAPLTLKADIIHRRVSQRLMQQKHIPNEYSLKGLAWIGIVLLALFVVSWGYFWFLGGQMRTSIDTALMRPDPGQAVSATIKK